MKTADGYESLWQGHPYHWTGQAPLLFPIVGGLADGEYTHNGSSYKMNSHGFARKSEWKVESHRDDAIIFNLTDSPEAMLQYPPAVVESKEFIKKEGIIILESGKIFESEYTVELV